MNDKNNKPEPCPGGCHHSDDEHQAFDDGVAVGENDSYYGASECPFSEANLREAWLSGYSVGGLNKMEPECV